MRAQAAREIAQHAERQREIIFAQNFPAIRPSALDGGVARHIPAIVLVAADDAIAGRGEEAVLRQIGDVILEQDQPRPPAGDIEAAQHFDFVAFDIDREEVEPRGRAGFLKHAVERPDRHLDDGFGRGARRHALAVERGQRTGHMQRQRAPGIVGRGTRDREHLGRTHGAQLAGEIGLRLDQDAGPAGLLQMPGLRALARIVGADLDEEIP